MDKTVIKEKYANVGFSLENAIKATDSINLSGEEEIAELTAVRNVLYKMNQDFKSEIDKLESSSEWDKFCLAFFGETNAGKSTIIESLRIIYDEESRRSRRILQQKEYSQLLNEHVDNFESTIDSLKAVNKFLKKYGKSSKAKHTILSLVIFAFGIGLGIVISLFGIF